MNNSIALIAILCVLTSGKPVDGDPRTQFFPKVELEVKNLPAKHNLWVFMLAGQSNMAGRGLVEPQDTVPSERILTINKTGKIIVAKEPLHFYEPTLTGLDCGLSFGKALAQQLPDSISILLIPTAVGGSSIGQWLGDSLHRNVRLMTNFIEKTDRAMHYGEVKGILWHQGESDTKPESVPRYKDRLAELFLMFRKIVGDEELPILLGGLGSYSDNQQNWMMINDQIRLYAASDPRTSVIETADLKNKGDKIHFDSEGQRTMGQRFAAAYAKMKK